MNDKWRKNLIIINLLLLALLLYSKLSYIHNFINLLTSYILIPLLLSIFIYYIIRPLNEIFIKKGMNRGWASLLTLSINTFILSVIINYFSYNITVQFREILKQITILIEDENTKKYIINKVSPYINIDETYEYINNVVQNYLKQLVHSIIVLFQYILNTFSTLLLIIVLVFYMLKDGNKFKERILLFIPEKYKDIASKTLSESDGVLSHYVIGQATVALSLSIMLFIGYKIIGMPSALLFCCITFILAFIPFVGFFISMIIPSIIGISMGLNMMLKLSIVFLTVQTLKGRIVVPAIMSRAMKIHPITDIFLVIGAVAVGGPLAAFSVVPIYAIVKSAIHNLKFFKAKS
jgi:predicted PurR-regulated permease PerM